MTRGNVPWTDEQDATLKLGLAAGLTTRQVAEQIGRTKNMVVGRMGRLNLRSSVKRGHAGGEPKKKPPDDVFKDAPAVEPASGVRMVDIGPNQCRWPLWGKDGWPDFRMCGAPGYPWCERHLAKANPRAVRP